MIDVMESRPKKDSGKDPQSWKAIGRLIFSFGNSVFNAPLRHTYWRGQDGHSKNADDTTATSPREGRALRASISSADVRRVIGYVSQLLSADGDASAGSCIHGWRRDSNKDYLLECSSH